jgi:hypothetical protein
MSPLGLIGNFHLMNLASCVSSFMDSRLRIERDVGEFRSLATMLPLACYHYFGCVFIQLIALPRNNKKLSEDRRLRLSEKPVQRFNFLFHFPHCETHYPSYDSFALFSIAFDDLTARFFELKSSASSCVPEPICTKNENSSS